MDFENNEEEAPISISSPFVCVENVQVKKKKKKKKFESEEELENIEAQVKII